MATTEADPRLEIITAGASTTASTLAQDVAAGFASTPRSLPPKHLYDARGCELFEEICELEEYYPTRTERAILTASAARIVASSGAGELVELGAGSATKTRVLLDAMARAGNLRRYVPFDIAASVVAPTAEAILAEYPEIERVSGVVGDFVTDLGLIPPPEDGTPRLVALLGSTIGNFVGEDRGDLLSGISSLLGPRDHFLLGADLVKDPAVLEAAYDDSAGVTAAFDLNLLQVINRELRADFPLERFRHVARWDAAHEWIEMRLIAEAACQVKVAALDLELDLAAGEEIRTEISAKFTPDRLRADLAGAGLELVELHTDPDDLFALVLARPLPRPRG